jgi:hypothetical protein
MRRSIKIFFSLLLSVASISAMAQQQVEMADTMRSNGKIYVIVGIILIVLAGLIAYLFTLDRKVKKLEDLLTQRSRPNK